MLPESCKTVEQRGDSDNYCNLNRRNGLQRLNGDIGDGEVKLEEL